MSPNKVFFSVALLTTSVVAAVVSFASPGWSWGQVCGSPSTAQLMSADGADVGDVHIWNSDGVLHTQFVPADGWRITGVQYLPMRFYSEMPTTADGSLDYQRFTYQRSYTTPMMGTTFQTATASDWELGADLHIAGRLVLVKVDANGQVTEQTTAWGEGKRSYNGAQYFKHTIQPCSG